MVRVAAGLTALLLAAGCATVPGAVDTEPTVPATASVPWSPEAAFERIGALLEVEGWSRMEPASDSTVLRWARSSGRYTEWVTVLLSARPAGGTDLRIVGRSTRGEPEGSGVARRLRDRILQKVRAEQAPGTDG